jgi:hypothetical protein
VVANTWDARDHPILRAIVEMSDDGAWYIEPPAIAEYTGLGVETVKAGLRALALEDPPFFEYSDRTGMGQSQREIGGIRNPTGHARRMVGMWPRPEDRIAEMIAVLWETAERELDPEQKSFLRRAAAYMAGIPRDVAAGILVAVGSHLAGG